MKTGYAIIIALFLFNGTFAMFNELDIYNTQINNYDLTIDGEDVITEIDEDIKGDQNHNSIIGDDTEFSVWSGAKFIVDSIWMIIKIVLRTLFVAEYLTVFKINEVVATFVQSIVTLIIGFYVYENKRTGKVA